ncbi:MAG TPA: hypothetical protein VND44_10940 [Acidimicrobiales bacterium]|nr:hypothetical protein [Acidimicrobiales bacterium]
MNDPVDLISKAGAVLGDGESVMAAGIFARKDDYLAVGGAAAMHASRSALAASRGLTVRMLVAVTTGHIRLLDWITGSVPSEVLASFDRYATAVKVTRFGLSRHVELTDPASGRSLVLTGSTAPFVSESKGDKAVLRALTEAG